MAYQRVLFGGYDLSGAYGLWSSDGTASGTRELSVAGASLYGVTFGSAFQFGATALFAGVNAQGATGLWTTDGTASGTRELAVAGAAPTGFGGLQPSDFARIGKLALFAGYNAANLQVLWKTDGTSAGTVQLSVGGASSAGLRPSGMLAVGNVAYFQGVDSAGRSQLWRTNGTGPGTVPILLPGASAGGLAPAHLTQFGKKLLFAGTDKAGDVGLWASGGTLASTAELKVAGAGAGGLQPGAITVLGARAWFAGLDAAGTHGLWSTDGTAAGTRKLAVAGASPLGLAPEHITALGARLLFSGYDDAGRQGLWVSDGTAAGTKELAVADASAAGLQPADFSVLGGKALFAGHDATDFVSLWETDGTAAGTHRLDVAGAGAFGLTPGGLTTLTFIEPNPLSVIAAPDPAASNGQTIQLGTLAGFTPGDTLRATLVSDAALSGSALSIDDSGRIFYTPGLILAAQAGPDAISYRVTDATLGQSVAGSALVRLSNGPGPIVTPLAGQIANNAHGATLGAVVPGLAGDALAVTLVDDPSIPSGSALALVDGQLVYTPGLITQDNDGQDRLTYTVTDLVTGAATTGFLFLTLSAGPAPTVQLVSPDATLANGRSAVIATATPTLPGDPLSVRLVSDDSFPAGSALSVDPDNGIVYTPGLIDAATVTADTIRFVVTDTVTGASTNGTARVTLSNGPAPVVILLDGPEGEPATVVGGQATAIATAAPGFADDPLAVALTGDDRFATGSELILGPDGRLLYTPGPVTAELAGPDMLTYSVTDTVTGAFVVLDQPIILVAGGAEPAAARPFADLWGMAHAA